MALVELGRKYDIARTRYLLYYIILFSTVGPLTTSALAALIRYLYKPIAPPVFLFSFPFSSFVSSLIDNPIVQACLYPSCCAHASID